MIIESVAQVARRPRPLDAGASAENRRGLGIERACAIGAWYAGDTMTIEVVMLKLKGTMGRMAGSVRVEGRLMARAS